MLRRGAEILGFGLLFRLQEFLIAWGWAPKSDLLRVDVLNIIGLSMMMMALLCGAMLAIFQRSSKYSDLGGRAPLKDRVSTVATARALAPVAATPTVPFAAAAITTAAIIALLTPPLYTTWRPIWLPWWLESYIDGCHNLGAPQPWLFCIFPWSAFAFAGLAAGFILFSEQGRSQTAKTLALFATVGAAAIVAAWLFDHSSIHLYSTYDYWHTSPNFLMMRIGMLLVIAFLSYAWCSWVLAKLGSWATRFSPLIQLGQTSLLVYWVHIEFVYGRFSLLPKRAESIAGATRGLVEIILFMLILSVLRTKIDWKSLGWKKMNRGVQPA